MKKFADTENYRTWIESQEWYQTIELSGGIKTRGKFATNLRTPVFDTIEFKGRTVLDIGCNSGQNSFLAKQRGATKVIGIDINESRLEQARTLAINEGYDVDFFAGSIFDLDQYAKADIVLCIAVLTEITDLFGAIQELKKVIGERAIIELNLARPLVYCSASKRWTKRTNVDIPRMRAITEVRKIKGNRLVLSPTFEVLAIAFGAEYNLTQKKGGIRYDLVEVVRK